MRSSYPSIFPNERCSTGSGGNLGIASKHYCIALGNLPYDLAGNGRVDLFATIALVEFAAAIQRIVAITALQIVGALLPRQAVVAEASVEDIFVRPADEAIISIAAGQVIAAGVAEQDIVSIVAIDVIVAGPTAYHVVAAQR